MLDVINEFSECLTVRVKSRLEELTNNERIPPEIRIAEMEGLKIELTILQDMIQIYVSTIEANSNLLKMKKSQMMGFNMPMNQNPLQNHGEVHSEEEE